MIHPSSVVEEALTGDVKSRESSSDDEEGNRRPIGAVGRAAEKDRLNCETMEIPCNDGSGDLHTLVGNRAHAKEPAASRLMAGRAGMIAMRLHFMHGDPAMVRHVGMGQAVDHGLAMSEGENCLRRHETKRRNGREYDREPKAQACCERDQHDLEIVMSIPPSPSLGPWRAHRKPPHNPACKGRESQHLKHPGSCVWAGGNVRFWHIADIDADAEACPLLGGKRTSPIYALTSAFDPKRTLQVTEHNLSTQPFLSCVIAWLRRSQTLEDPIRSDAAYGVGSDAGRPYGALPERKPPQVDHRKNGGNKGQLPALDSNIEGK